MNSPDNLWNTALGQLQLQMTQATFDTWVKNTHLVEHTDGHLVVAAETSFAKDWLENRLLVTINRTVANLLGHPIDIQFIVQEPAPIPQPSPQAEPDPSAIPLKIETPFAQTFAYDTDFYAIKMNMGRWLPEMQYDNLFWSAYLGPAYTFYRHILIFWTRQVKKKDQYLFDMTKPANNCFTPIFSLSYRRATNWLGKTNYKIIPGGVYECHKSEEQFKAGQRLAQCQNCHSTHDWRPDGAGGRCYYFRPGLLHRLYDENLIAIEISDTGRAKLQAWRSLALLTPWQVNQLNSLLQDQHENWLEHHGPAFGLSFDTWLKIDYPYMAAFRNEHGTRLLFGAPPANPFENRDHVVAISNNGYPKTRPCGRDLEEDDP